MSLSMEGNILSALGPYKSPRLLLLPRGEKWGCSHAQAASLVDLPLLLGDGSKERSPGAQVLQRALLVSLQEVSVGAVPRLCRVRGTAYLVPEPEPVAGVYSPAGLC